MPHLLGCRLARRRVVGDGLRGDRQQPDPAHRGGGAAARPDVRVRPPAGVGRGAGRGVAAWRSRAGARAVLRPAIPLAADGTSSLARALTAGLGHRFGEADPGAQFVHHDDVAVGGGARRRAPARRRLQRGARRQHPRRPGAGAQRHAGSGCRCPTPSPISSARCGGASSAGRSRPAAVVHAVPVDVANDKLRAEGWAPTVSNEQAYVEGTEAKWWTDGHAQAPPGARARAAMIGAIATSASSLWPPSRGDGGGDGALARRASNLQ